MRLPAPLLRRNPRVHKNTFGHVLVLAGSPSMLGAGALASLAALRTGAGLVTWGVPKSLNIAAQKKASPAVMTLSLPETRSGTLASSAYAVLRRHLAKFNVIAVGPGLSRHPSTVKFVQNVITRAGKPLVIDADALFAVSGHTDILTRSDTPKILTPHPGEMARLCGLKKDTIEKKRRETARKFADGWDCILVLKGNRTVIAAPGHTPYVNTTGNAGMAKGGSGDVLTGMVAAVMAQGVSPFEAAKTAVFLHGRAGDRAARQKTKLSMIATDIIEQIPEAVRSCRAA